jgi:hypothetical protein
MAALELLHATISCLAIKYYIAVSVSSPGLHLSLLLTETQGSWAGTGKWSPEVQ